MLNELVISMSVLIEFIWHLCIKYKFDIYIHECVSYHAFKLLLPLFYTPGFIKSETWQASKTQHAARQGRWDLSVLHS